MKKVLSTIVAALVAVSFSAVVFAADAAKPEVKKEEAPAAEVKKDAKPAKKAKKAKKAAAKKEEVKKDAAAAPVEAPKAK